MRIAYNKPTKSSARAPKNFKSIYKKYSRAKKKLTKQSEIAEKRSEKKAKKQSAIAEKRSNKKAAKRSEIAAKRSEKKATKRFEIENRRWDRTIKRATKQYTADKIHKTGQPKKASKSKPKKNTVRPPIPKPLATHGDPFLHPRPRKPTVTTPKPPTRPTPKPPTRPTPKPLIRATPKPPTNPHRSPYANDIRSAWKKKFSNIRDKPTLTPKRKPPRLGIR